MSDDWCLQHDKLAAALVAFQGDVPTIPKNREAKIPTKSGGSYSYRYADLTDIWDAIRGPLKKNGLAVTQTLKGGSTGFMGIRTTVWHSSGQHLTDVVEVRTEGKTPQEVGSLVTYYKRYALSAALGIATDEDDDGAAASAAPPVKSKSSVKTLEAAKQELRDAIAKSGVDGNDYKWVAGATVEDIEKIRGIAAALNLGKVPEHVG